MVIVCSVSCPKCPRGFRPLITTGYYTRAASSEWHSNLMVTDVYSIPGIASSYPMMWSKAFVSGAREVVDGSRSLWELTDRKTRVASD